ncbi:Cupin domain-containing protein [Reichenbachiella faecimaris]|uniref:Cupin domain-containing protein n=1 Tax=Reichenbachiella faecimaris TaxID=692418 RepID=A0A1W2GL19_REIFA|nr:cupin domain-containing protein [Reichenbachiella faecimaris]SMD36976.1 Cupin domain-containing protein [Reichenbachiella faecimaris]
MIFHERDSLIRKELVPGISGELIHTETMSIGYFDIEKGAILPEHSHVHEQVTSLLAGELEMTVNGESKIMKAGHVATIPPHAVHAALALTDCKVIDVFNPVREDYK